MKTFHRLLTFTAQYSVSVRVIRSSPTIVSSDMFDVAHTRHVRVDPPPVQSDIESGYFMAKPGKSAIESSVDYSESFTNIWVQ